MGVVPGTGYAYASWGGARWCGALLCSRRVRFAFLPPGKYALTPTGDGACLELRIRLLSGANVEVVGGPIRGRWEWRRDDFRYFYSQG